MSLIVVTTIRTKPNRDQLKINSLITNISSICKNILQVMMVEVNVFEMESEKEIVTVMMLMVNM